MKLKYAADWRTVLWAFGLFPAVTLAMLVWPRAMLWLWPLALYDAFCAGVLAHNQNHCPTFQGRRANAFYSSWISVFYGYPIFVWGPTHNRNHHHFLNRPGDATITWRYSRRNTLLAGLGYVFVSPYFQRGVIGRFLHSARAISPRLYRQIQVQRAAFVAGHLGLLLLAVLLHGSMGLVVYLLAVALPTAVGMGFMMFVNFIQHVDCDPWSPLDHSRNFTARLENWFLFNNGLHTAHHERPGLHWSLVPALDARLAPGIHPDLRRPSLFGFIARTYLLRAGTEQVGRAAYDVPVAS
jgi:beta-carotene hydroxylase